MYDLQMTAYENDYIPLVGCVMFLTVLVAGFDALSRMTTLVLEV